jgi:serine/threonine protein kinase
VRGSIVGLQVGKRNTFVGTPFWMAPEVIRQSDYDEKVHEPASAWPFGSHPSP